MLQTRSTLRRAFNCLLAGAICFGFHTPSHADIIVRGANGKKAIELNNWCIRHIAPQFRPRQDVVVRQLSDSEMATYLNGDNPTNNSNDRSGSDNSTDDIDGVFENDPPRITLRLPGGSDPDMFTFAHEYGHFVWFDLMTKEDRKRYESIYKHQRDEHRLVTRYASTDVEEGFAEAFSFFVNEPPVLERRDSATFAFLTDWQTHAAAASYQ